MVRLDAEDRIVWVDRDLGPAATAEATAESKARQARTRLIDAIESIPASFVLFDADDRLVMWNSKAPEYLHEVRDLLVFGQRYEALVAGAAHGGAIADAVGREDDWIAEQMAWHRRPEGAREIRYRDGRTLQIQERRTDDRSTVCIRTDVTEIRRGREQLAESEQRYRALVEASPDILMAVSDGRIRFVNAAGALQLGADNTERIIGWPLGRFVDDEDVQRARDLVSSALGGLAPKLQEMRMRGLDGGAFEADVAAIRFVDGGAPAVQLVVRDVTQRKIAEAQLIQASKLATLGEMAAGLAHELNQPLNIIRMAADASLILMEDGETDLEDHREQFTRISEQTQRMAGIIDHMRVFSRLDTSDGEVFDLVGCVRRSADLIVEQYRLDDILIEITGPDDPLMVHGHPIRMEQVVLNLLSNARDAIHQRRADGAWTGRIGLCVERLARAGRRARIRVTDNGGGISADALPRIFDPFFTTKQVGMGTGLGLSISYGIVGAMGGTLEASNTQDGALFRIELPELRDAGPPP